MADAVDAGTMSDAQIAFSVTVTSCADLLESSRDRQHELYRDQFDEFAVVRAHIVHALSHGDSATIVDYPPGEEPSALLVQKLARAQVSVRRELLRSEHCNCARTVSCTCRLHRVRLIVDWAPRIFPQSPGRV